MRPSICSAVLLSCFLLVVDRPTQSVEENVPPGEEWQIKGILSALEDDYSEVKVKALKELLNLFEPEKSDTGKVRRWRERSHGLVMAAMPDVEKLLRDAN